LREDHVLALSHFEFFVLHSDFVVVDVLLELVEELSELDLDLVVLGLHTRKQVSDVLLFLDYSRHIVSELASLIKHRVNVAHLYLSLRLQVSESLFSDTSSHNLISYDLVDIEQPTQIWQLTIGLLSLLDSTL